MKKLFKRFKKVKTDAINKGVSVGETPDGKCAPLLEDWMADYFPFRGIVTSTTKNTANVQTYGRVDLVVRGS